MSQKIMKTSLALALVALFYGIILTIYGCGDGNSNSFLDPDTGKHPGGWLPGGHASAARSHLDSCQPCHGEDFRGGISNVSCFQCHLGNQTHVHPLEWDNLVYALHGNWVNQHGTAACANVYCHGANLQGVSGSGPSCTSCHIGDATHVHPWTPTTDFAATPPLHGQYVDAHGTGSCRNATCHGANLQGVFLSGPPCSECHPGVNFP